MKYIKNGILPLLLGVVLLVGLCALLRDSGRKETSQNSQTVAETEGGAGTTQSAKATESSAVTSKETSSAVTESVSSALSTETEGDTTPVETELPEVSEPETTKPETTKPETTKPETTKPETTVPETATPPATTETQEPTPQKIIKIYIDQGHNPHSHNTGANGNGLREQDINYVVGQELAALLSADPRFAVKLSRPTEDTLLGTDNTSSLKARTDEANGWGADYFISLHCNAFTEASAHGTEVLVYSTASEGYALGERILEKLVAGTGLRNRGVKVKPELYVLRHTTMPAVLVEMGFITNPSDAALMASRPDLFAACIRDGILAYLNP